MKFELVTELDILNNRKIIILLNALSLLLLIFLVLVSPIFIFPIFSGLHTIEIELGISELISLFTAYFILIFIHEFIHVLTFKVFKPHAQIKYGFKKGMAYASAPGEIYSKSQFSIISIMPFFLISIGLYILTLFGISSLFCYSLFILHTASCVGDFYYCLLLLDKSNDYFVEDTEKGIKILRKIT